MLQSHEFMVGIAVAAIMLSALFASSLFRNIALALAAGAIVVLYLQGGISNLLHAVAHAGNRSPFTPDCKRHACRRRNRGRFILAFVRAWLLRVRTSRNILTVARVVLGR